MRKLNVDFYRRNNVVVIARELLGKILVTKWNGIETSGRIVEVEAEQAIALAARRIRVRGRLVELHRP